VSGASALSQRYRVSRFLDRLGRIRPGNGGGSFGGAEGGFPDRAAERPLPPWFFRGTDLRQEVPGVVAFDAGGEHPFEKGDQSLMPFGAVGCLGQDGDSGEAAQEITEVQLCAVLIHHPRTGADVPWSPFGGNRDVDLAQRVLKPLVGGEKDSAHNEK
jgi:hypothetical protein